MNGWPVPAAIPRGVQMWMEEGAVVVNNPLSIICRVDKTGNRSTWLLGLLLP